MRSEKFSTEAEVIKELDVLGAGPVLHTGRDGSNYSYTGEGHTLYLGVSGVGKSRSGTIPLTQSIVSNGESAIIIDPKGEIYKNVYVPDGYDKYIIDFHNIGKENTDGFNILTAPYELYRSDDPDDRLAAEQMIGDIAYCIYPDSASDGKYSDPFWITEARNVFIGAVYTLFNFGKPEEINITSVYSIIMKGDDHFDGMSTYLKELTKLCNEKGSIIAEQLHSYVTTAPDTKGGIRSVMLNGLSVFSQSDSIRKFLSHNDLRINHLTGDKPTIIFIILPDETQIYDKLASIITNQLTTHFIRIAERDHAGKLPIKMNIVLEELANIGNSLPNLSHLLAASRSRNLRMHLVLQSLSQLNDLYGNSAAETILANCDVKIAFRTNNMHTLKELSALCGIKTYRSEIGTTVAEPLITESQLAALENRQALVMIKGRIKFITWLPDFTEMNIMLPDNKNNFKRTNRETVYADKVFDIQNFIKEFKRRKTIEDFDKIAKRNVSFLTERDRNLTLAELQRDIDLKIALLDREEKSKRNKAKSNQNKEKSTQKSVEKSNDNKETNTTDSDN
jgi:Type IV secretory pathway, VirD4 components